MDPQLVYVESEPQQPLRRYVRCIWVLETPPGALPPPPDRVLPDGCVEIVVHFADGFERRGPTDATPATQHRHAVVGQIRTALHLKPLGRVGVLGARLEPAGAGPFLGAQMHGLSGRSAALEDVRGSLACDLADAVHAATTPFDRIRAAARVLVARAAALPLRRTLAEEAAGAILAAGGSLALSDLCAELGAAGRRLERCFRDDVGLAPKTLARIVRFQSAVAALRAARRPIAAHVAVDCGYCDQAHLTRDFSEFAGAPPTQWLRQEHAFAAAFVR